jgi:hypothetical protein
MLAFGRITMMLASFSVPNVKERQSNEAPSP